MGFIFDGYLLEGIIGVVTLCAYIFYKWMSKFNYWKERNVPYLEPTFPFGNTKDFFLLSRFIGFIFNDFYSKLKGHKYGGIFSLTQPMLIIRDPEIIRQLLVKDFTHFTDRGEKVDEENDPLSANLFSLSGEKWRWLRIKLSPTFTSGKMKMMFHLMKNCGEEFSKSLSDYAKNENVIELRDFLARFLTDVIGSCAFGLEIDSIKHPDNEFRRVSKDVFDMNISMMIKMVMIQYFPKISRSLLKLRINGKEVEDFFLKIVSDTVEYRETNNIKRNDFLHLLIQLKNKGIVEDDSVHHENDIHEHDSDKELKHDSSQEFEFTKGLMAAQCFVFFVAGFETSSNTLSFCLYELAINKPVQIKLQEEIDKVLNKYNGDISYESLKEMKYMDRVIQETLRKYPPVSFLTRECVSDYILEEGNLKIEKGVQIVTPVLGIHYDEQYYPDPDRFDPERFTDEAKQSRPHYTWLPFGEGPRNCIGMRFALLQVKTGLATLLSSYNFDRVQETQVPPEYDSKKFLTTPKYGIKLKISNRKK